MNSFASLPSLLISDCTAIEANVFFFFLLRFDRAARLFLIETEGRSVVCGYARARIRSPGQGCGSADMGREEGLHRLTGCAAAASHFGARHSRCPPARLWTTAMERRGFSPLIARARLRRIRRALGTAVCCAGGCTSRNDQCRYVTKVCRSLSFG